MYLVLSQLPEGLRRLVVQEISFRKQIIISVFHCLEFLGIIIRLPLEPKPTPETAPEESAAPMEVDGSPKPPAMTDSTATPLIKIEPEEGEPEIEKPQDPLPPRVGPWRYRLVKEVLKLPDKYKKPLEFEAPDPKEYFVVSSPSSVLKMWEYFVACLVLRTSFPPIKESYFLYARTMNPSRSLGGPPTKVPKVTPRALLALKRQGRKRRAPASTTPRPRRKRAKKKDEYDSDEEEEEEEESLTETDDEDEEPDLGTTDNESEAELRDDAEEDGGVKYARLPLKRKAGARRKKTRNPDIIEGPDDNDGEEEDGEGANGRIASQGQRRPVGRQFAHLWPQKDDLLLLKIYTVQRSHILTGSSISSVMWSKIKGYFPGKNEPSLRGRLAKLMEDPRTAASVVRNSSLAAIELKSRKEGAHILEGDLNSFDITKAVEEYDSLR